MCRIDERSSWTQSQRWSPEEWDHLKRHVTELAQDARNQAIRDLAGGVLSRSQAAAQDALDAIRKRWSAYRLWRERRAAIRALGALDDRMRTSALAARRLHPRSAIRSGWRRALLPPPADRSVARVRIPEAGLNP